MSEPILSVETIITPPNLKIYSGPDSLPPGSFLKYKPGIDFSPLDNFVTQAAANLGIPDRSRMLTVYRDETQLDQIAGGVFSSLVSHMQDHHPISFEIAREMSRMQPNLAWMRGGELTIVDNVAVLDYPGADGLIGQNVESFAKTDYYYHSRKNPCIFWVLWNDVVDTIKQRLYRPATHNIYDFSFLDLGWRKKDIDWQRQHLVVYKILT